MARAALIVMMVLFHSFGQAQLATSLDINQATNINRWMGLVSGSFPFLSGFLVSFRYFRVLQPTNKEIQGLISRGGKLLGLYLAINLSLIVFAWLFDEVPILVADPPSFTKLITAEHESMSYELLFPLGVIVLVGAGLLISRRYYRNDNFLRAALAAEAVFLAWSEELILVYVACGLAGLLLGAEFARPQVAAFLKRHWGAGLLALIPGVVLAVLEHSGPDFGLLYLLAVSGLFFAYHNLGRFSLFAKDGRVSRITMLLARGSLVIYIVHIPQLQVLGKITAPIFTESQLWLAFSSYVVVVLVSMCVMLMLMERYRPAVDQFLANWKLNPFRQPIG